MTAADLDLEALKTTAHRAVHAADDRQERSMKLMDAMQEFMAISDDVEHATLKRLAVLIAWADAHCERSVDIAVESVAAYLAGKELES